LLCLFVELSEQTPTSQHGVYEKAQGVQNYAAFAPPVNSEQGTNGPAAPVVQETQIPKQPANYKPALDVMNYASFAPPNFASLQMEMSPR